MNTTRTGWSHDTAGGRGHPLAVDAVVALVLLAVTVAGYEVSQPQDFGTGGWWLSVGAAVAGCAALLGHRDYPGAVVAVTAACAAVTALQGFLLSPLTIGPLMAALYWMAVGSDRTAAPLWGAGSAGLLVAATLIDGPTEHAFVVRTVNPAVWVLLMPLLGGYIALRREYLRAVEARAAFAERTREEEARHRVVEERIRIARELHDVVAHHMALANVQAGAAVHLARTHPDPRITSVLKELAGTTASALRELKGAVGVLRHVDETSSPLQPTPGLAQLPELAASFATAGLHVTVTVEGAVVPISSGIQLTAYRIIQEALTNVVKHAGTDRADVRLAYRSKSIIITITDDGAIKPPGAASIGDAGTGRRPEVTTGPRTPAEYEAEPAGGGSGYGLTGMIERAQIVGGRLSAGRRAQNGYQVRAQLPLLPHDLRPEEDSAA